MDYHELNLSSCGHRFYHKCIACTVTFVDKEEGQPSMDFCYAKNFGLWRRICSGVLLARRRVNPPPPDPQRKRTTPYGGKLGKGQGKGKGRREGKIGQGGRGRSQGGETPMGTTPMEGKGPREGQQMVIGQSAADENKTPWRHAEPPGPNPPPRTLLLSSACLLRAPTRGLPPPQHCQHVSKGLQRGLQPRHTGRHAEQPTDIGANGAKTQAHLCCNT